MKKNLLINGIIILCLCSSCDEDFEVNAPYKDITIVYGLLNHVDSIHYIRIQKAFLGNGNALVYCTIPDSLYYPPGLDAYILGYDQGGIKVEADSFHLERVVNDVDKDSGLFAAYNNVLYKGFKSLNPHHVYELVIIKPNGDTVSCKTPLAANVILPPPPQALDWEPNSIVDPEKNVNFTWVEDPNAFVYQVSLYFYYQEWKAGNPGNVENKKAVYHCAMFKPTGEFKCNSNVICYPVSKSQFYFMITTQIEADPENTLPSELRLRKFISMDVKISAAVKEFYNYILINAPSLSYVQKTTTYTNIHNGLGIFSSRTSNSYTGLTLNQQTRDSLRWGQYTSHLNFQP